MDYFYDDLGSEKLEAFWIHGIVGHNGKNSHLDYCTVEKTNFGFYHRSYSNRINVKDKI